MGDTYRHEVVLGVDVIGDGEERAQRKRSVGGIGKMSDGFSFEGVARATYKCINSVWHSLSVWRTP